MISTSSPASSNSSKASSRSATVTTRTRRPKRSTTGMAARSGEKLRTDFKAPLRRGFIVLRGQRALQRQSPASKLQRGVVDDFLHHEEGAGLAHAGQADQLLAMDAVEVLHVADAD